jgi:hypothetical protein
MKKTAFEIGVAAESPDMTAPHPRTRGSNRARGRSERQRNPSR